MNLTKENPEPYPLNTNPAIQDCASRRCGENWCRFSESVKGWGCRFLLIVPNRLPATKKERGMLFSNAYAHAEKSGILQCPFFDESLMDKVVENKKELSAMMRVCSPTVEIIKC